MNIERLAEFISNHWIMSSGLFVVTLLLIQDFFDILTRKYKSTPPAGVVTLLNTDDDTLVIDLREPHEFVNGHIQGARNILFSKLDEKLAELGGHKSAPVVVACQQGTRSSAACKKLVKAGFTRVHDLRGGILAWQDAKLPLVKNSKK